MTVRLTIFGSTGSVGENTLDLVRSAGPGCFKVVCLTANSNAEFLVRQALEFRPERVVLSDPSNADYLRDALGAAEIDIGIGRKALVEAGALPADITIAAIIGTAGLEPTLEAVKQGNRVGLANKECLVSAGELFMKLVSDHGTDLVPVDSEHSAIFQVLRQKRPQDVRRLILTASGGPFLGFSREELTSVTKVQALAHPVWDMGEKITVDSATLMNKGLELIEASYLFGRPSQDIEIVIHPQSIVHGLVDYVDGSVLAQMGSPDMHMPIAYALSCPKRMQTTVKPLDLVNLSRLDFYAPDPEKFPALHLARESLEQGGAAPTVLNATNEVAVAAFLTESIPYQGITRCIETVLNRFKSEASFAKPPKNLEEVRDLDKRARRVAWETVIGIS